MEFIQLTSLNAHIYEDSLTKLEHIFSPEYETYAFVEDSNIIAYAILKTTSVIYDLKDKYINKTFIKNIKICKKAANNFRKADICCLYNLCRLPGIKYVGLGIALVNKILNIKKQIYLATTVNKLYKYYLLNGFKPTNYFDIDCEGIWRKVLLKEELPV